MSEVDELRQHNQLLQDRLSRLYEASLRIGESLDLDTVLREVMESACALTGASHGGIVTMDGAGQLQDFVTSGLTPAEHKEFLEVPQGPGLWEYLHQVPQPLRLPDLAAHVIPLGFPDHPLLQQTFLAAPIRHRDVQLGNFFLAGKESGLEFTSADEELLVLFASQAGAAIANARKHRDEQRARSDLEALIETSPVGVVVFDARSGRVASLNRESQRIVGDLGIPGRSAEELLEVLRVRRADGREILLEDTPVADWLREATTVRAEEVVLQVPDGRQVTVLVNATAIRAEDGAVESLVVTMQDMTPLEELERLRAEFLGLVSHELQAPLVSIKGCATTALGATTGRDPAQTQLFFRLIDEQADHMQALIADLLDAARIEMGTLSVAPEPVGVEVMVDQARKTFLGGGRRNPVRIDLPPDLPRVLADRQRIVQVLVNLLTNAARHSPEASAIRVAAACEGMHVAVSVADEGRGIPADRLSHLFRKFAGGGEDREGGVGAGLGLSICKGLVEAHGGRIRAESETEGLGTRFTFTMPVAEEAGDGPAGNSPSRRRKPAQARVLVVDDDPQALEYVRRILQEAGYDALVTGDPEEVAGLLETCEPDLVLLDLLLPGTGGIELMERLPALGERPVIFLSVYDRDETIARALDLGAADYVVKPFSPTELVARIRAALRRAGEPVPYRAGDLAILAEERRVTLAGRPVELTATEYDLLTTLAAKAGRVSTHEDLLRRVWRERNKGDTRVVHAFVRRPAAQAGRRRRQPEVHFLRAARRLPHAQTGQWLRAYPSRAGKGWRGRSPIRVC